MKHTILKFWLIFVLSIFALAGDKQNKVSTHVLGYLVGSAMVSYEYSLAKEFSAGITGVYSISNVYGIGLFGKWYFQNGFNNSGWLANSSLSYRKSQAYNGPEISLGMGHQWMLGDEWNTTVVADYGFITGVGLGLQIGYQF